LGKYITVESVINPYVLFEFSAGAIPASLKFTGAIPVS
jgi:hypothetical protein